MSKFTDFIKDRYMGGGSDLDLGNIAKDVGVAGALYGIVNPNDSSGLASFFGTGGRQQPVGYTGGIPNYTATRELVPNAFAQTYTTPTGEVAPRRPGGAGRRYFTDTTFTQDTGTPFMGITAEQIVAQNQAAQDELDFFESLLGSAAAQREAAAAEQTTTDTTDTATTDTTGQTTGQTTGTDATTSITYTGSNLDELNALPLYDGPQQMTADEVLAAYVDPEGGFSEQEQRTVANIITSGQKSIGEIADLYGDVETIDVVEGLLRGGFQTPEQIAAMSPDIDEPKLIAVLLEEGKTTPEEVAAYYKDHPVYGGITPEQVVTAFRGMGGERFARGGIAQGQGYYLGGPTDGMADQIPATINNMEPARLSDGEFVIPADVVSHLGNGNSDAGAQNLYGMMERVRKDRTGNPKQGKQIDPNKYLA